MEKQATITFTFPNAVMRVDYKNAASCMLITGATTYGVLTYATYATYATYVTYATCMLSPSQVEATLAPTYS
jgi:hypothetical protein